MRLHPRFDTTAGWDDWIACVAEVRRLKLWLADTGHKHSADSGIEELLESHKRGAHTSRDLWIALDLLVCAGTITSAEQRELFWEAHPRLQRLTLIQIQPYFNPQERGWSTQYDESISLAEQRLSQIMEFSAFGEEAVRLQKKEQTVRRSAGYGTAVSLPCVLIACHGTVVRNATNVNTSQNVRLANILRSFFSIAQVIAAILMVLIIFVWLFWFSKTWWQRLRWRLRLRDIEGPAFSIAELLVCNKSAAEVIASKDPFTSDMYAARVIRAPEFWFHVQDLVGAGKLSRAEGRQGFWDRLSPEWRQYLADRCETINPDLNLWSTDDTSEAWMYVDRIMTQRLVSQYRKIVTIVSLFLLTSILGLCFWSINRHAELGSSRRVLAALFAPMPGAFEAILFAVALACCACLLRAALRRQKKIGAATPV